MNTSPKYSSDVAFTPTVKAVQEEKGSRRAYARVEAGGAWEEHLTPELIEFIEQQNSCFLGTANAAGQPYIQHRGGPPGFLRVLDDKTIAFADYAGNRQYISIGNLRDNPKAFLFLIDYAERQRIKLWGTARFVEDDPALIARIMPAGYNAKPERALVFSVATWDANCPQHIPQKLEATDVARAIAQRDARIAELEATIRELDSQRLAASLPREDLRGPKN
jgi:uncharacterized protein